MNLADVMQEVADQLDTITGLRVFAYPLDGPPSPPSAIVGYPIEYEYDATYGRGSDRITDLPVIVVVGRVYDRTSRDAIGAFVDGAGDSSIKQVIEAGEYTAFDEVRVARVEFDVISIGGTEYLAATFTLDITGSGGS